MAVCSSFGSRWRPRLTDSVTVTTQPHVERILTAVLLGERMTWNQKILKKNITK